MSIEASCQGKVKHESKTIALSILKKGMTGHPYRCESCGYWHIGNSEKINSRPEWKPSQKKRGKRK